MINKIMYLLMKTAFYKPKIIVTKYYISANLFNDWLHGKPLNSLIYLCLQSAIISYNMQPLEGSTVHLRENESGSGQLCLNSIWS